MTKDTYRKLKRLLERFMAGETTLAEEQYLYRIFADNKDLGAFEAYRPRFAWYAAAAPAPRRKAPRRWLRLAAAACLVLTVAIVALMGINHHNEQNELYAHLQGSYVRINGQNIPDVSKIYDRQLSAEYTADSLESIMDKDYDVLNKNIVNETLAGISDPEIAALISADLLCQDI